MRGRPPGFKSASYVLHLPPHLACPTPLHRMYAAMQNGSASFLKWPAFCGLAAISCHWLAALKCSAIWFRFGVHTQQLWLGVWREGG